MMKEGYGGVILPVCEETRDSENFENKTQVHPSVCRKA